MEPDENGDMQSIETVVRQLARFVREQREQNKRQEETNRELTAMRANDREELKAVRSMLSGQAEELRDIKGMVKRQQRFAEDHERTLRLHYRLIRDWRDKGR